MTTPEITLPAAGHPPPWRDAAARCAACEEPFPRDALFCGACGAARYEDPRLGEIVLGRYRLVEELGAGGMGAVYRAEQRVGRFTRSVAVKVLHPGFAASPAIRARFMRECAIVVQLEHPNTIRFYDFGELEDGSLAIVMELVEGETLSERIERAPIPVREALAILRQIAGSLDEAHRMGVVHRDLKPDNVILFDQPGLGIGVKVLDFGVATAPAQNGAPDEAAAITFRGEVLGTPAYMSPEQVSATELDARSDVYSLGVVAYEMLTGVLPYGEASGLVEWAERHLFHEPTPIDAHPVAATLSADARAALMSALAKEPADRPSGVLAFVRALRGGVSISAPPPAEIDDALVLPVARAPRRIAMLLAAALAGLAALTVVGLPDGGATARKLDASEKPSAALVQCEAPGAPGCG